MSKVDGYSIGQITIIELIGADRNKIVNNLCTQDLRQLQAGESKETFVLDPKGRTLAHGIACCSDKKTWFLTVPNQAPKLVPKLLLIQQEYFSSLTSSMESLIESDCDDRTGWEQARIENFWPWFGVDVDDKNLPQELDIDARAISFKKGCYLGQETVARLDALGQVQKRLCLVDVYQKSSDTSVPVAPVVGQSLHVEGKQIGTITSLVQTPLDKHHWIALAMLKRSAFQTEASLNTDGGLTTTIRHAV